MAQTVRIYAEKSNTIASGIFQNINTSQQQVFSLFYGGGASDTTVEKRNAFSRHLVYFNLTGLQTSYANFTYNSAYTVSYTLKFKNAIPSDKILERGKNFDSLDKTIASGFDLIFFPINKNFYEGRGSSFEDGFITFRNFSPIYSGVSNNLSASTLVSWDAPGVFVNPTASTTNYAIQHFETGAEDIRVNVTAMVNDWLSGGSTNNGIGICYARPFELTSADTRYISSFYSNKSSSQAFAPYLEVSFSNNSVIHDDRHWVTNNRESRLYLYTFSGNQAVNYFSANTVVIKNSANAIVHTRTPVHQGKGIYYISVFFSGSTKGNKFRDIWSGVTFVPGYDQQDITQSIDIRDNFFGTAAKKTGDYSVDVYGLSNGSQLAIGEIHRIYADVRVSYSNQKPTTDFGLEYRMTMGLDETLPWSPMNSAIIDDCLTCFFDLDTSWLLNAQIYTVEFRIAEFGTKRLLSNKLTFSVINTI